MKFLSLATPALLVASASVSARSTLFKADIVPLDTSLAVPGENPLEHCADPAKDVLVLKSVDLDPNPPKAGTTLTVKASGVLTEDVEEGAKVHLQVKYGLITIIRQTADLCDTVQNVDLECPLKKGEITIEKDVDLPNQIPPGKYSVTADVVTKDDDKITCLQATVSFERGGGVGLWKQGL